MAKLCQTEWSCYSLFEEILQWRRKNRGQDEAHIKFSKTKYPNDFTDELDSEMRSFATESRKEISVTETVLEVNNLMLQSCLSSSFQETYNLLILFITLPVTVASAERSFSKLKMIKTYLRSTMSQERHDYLAILSNENKEANKIDKTKLIRDFANIDARIKAHVVSKST